MYSSLFLAAGPLLYLTCVSSHKGSPHGSSFLHELFIYSSQMRHYKHLVLWPKIFFFFGRNIRDRGRPLTDCSAANEIRSYAPYYGWVQYITDVATPPRPGVRRGGEWRRVVGCRGESHRFRGLFCLLCSSPVSPLNTLIPLFLFLLFSSPLSTRPSIRELNPGKKIKTLKRFIK